ncbi:MAG: hypothetical protein GWN87_14215, partial [Desulfuromonadales bacterium]|nr:hypothetical protein [Desulfuromonadales bacterium]NIS41492.1 hypothetical protein [Desulfuromonadales bacterium]
LLVAIMLVARFSMVLFLEGVLARLAEWLEKRREAREARKLQKAKEKGLKIDTAPKVTPPEKPKKVPP